MATLLKFLFRNYNLGKKMQSHKVIQDSHQLEISVQWITEVNYW